MIQAKKNTNDGSGSETATTLTTSGSNSESKQADPLKKTTVTNEIQKPKIDNAKSVPSKLLGDKVEGNVQKDPKAKKMVDDPKRETKPESKSLPKEDNLASIKKGSFGGEQCDSSFKCTIGNEENHGMVACLSVPGDGMLYVIYIYV